MTFSSTRSIGLFDDVETNSGETSDYTLITDATDEEDKAVTTATLATFFVTWLIAMALGLVFAIFCCARCCNMGGKSQSGKINVATEIAATGGNNTPNESEGNMESLPASARPLAHDKVTIEP